MSRENHQSLSADALTEAILQARANLRSTVLEDTGNPEDFPIPECPDKPPLVSVEVLVYNQARTLRQCVESIVRQKTDFPFEVIIGNDCSTDASLEVALALQREYPNKIRILSTRHNVGLNRNARNVRRAMRGIYAAFCEGDDWWLTETRLQEQVDVLRSHPNVSLVHGCTRFYDEPTGSFTENTLRRPLPPNRFARVFDETYRVETAGAVCRVQDLMRIYAECPHLVDARFLMLDTQLFCLLAAWGEVVCLPYPVSVRRLSGHSLSRNTNPTHSLTYHDSAFHMMLTLCGYFHQGALARARIANHYLSSAYQALRRIYPRRDAIHALQRLYPTFKARIACLGCIPEPRARLLRTFFYHFVFPVARYRHSFRTIPVPTTQAAADD